MHEILANQEVMEGLIGVIVAGLAVVGGLLGLALKKIIGLQKTTKGTHEQVVNTHGPSGKDDNLREQIDRIEALQLKTADTMEAQGRKIDHVTGEIHERIVAEKKDRQQLAQNAHDEHKALWKAIEKK